MVNKPFESQVLHYMPQSNHNAEAKQSDAHIPEVLAETRKHLGLAALFSRRPRLPLCVKSFVVPCCSCPTHFWNIHWLIEGTEWAGPRSNHEESHSLVLVSCSSALPWHRRMPMERRIYNRSPMTKKLTVHYRIDVLEIFGWDL